MLEDKLKAQTKNCLFIYYCIIKNALIICVIFGDTAIWLQEHKYVIKVLSAAIFIVCYNGYISSLSIFCLFSDYF